MGKFNNAALLSHYMQKKREKAQLIEEIYELEKEILEVYGDNVPEDKSTKTFTDEDFKIKISRNISYKCSEEGWEIINKMPLEERPVKISLDETKAKKMECLKEHLIFHETKPTIDVTRLV